MLRREDMSDQLAQIYSRVSLECKAYIENDPLVHREDTCRGLLALLEQLRQVLAALNALKAEERARHYHVAYNAVTYILDVGEHLRRTNFSFELLPLLAEAVRAMEENLILSDVKYLDKRTELYIKLARIYEEWEHYPEAVALLDSAAKSYKALRAIHEQDPPVPSHILTILSNNLKLLKVFHIKYSIQAGSLLPVDWKKKAEEEFGDDTDIKLLSLIEALRTETKKHNNIFTKNLKNYKETLLQSGFEMVRPFLETLAKGLSQQRDRIEREVNFRTLSNSTQQDINQEIQKRRETEDKYIR
jgi:tetratricopeptide (TPR) repeat protein